VSKSERERERERERESKRKTHRISEAVKYNVNKMKKKDNENAIRTFKEKLVTTLTK
jgi:hypothetical protein